MAEEHATAEAFEKAIQDALTKFKATVEGAPQEKTHKPDAEQFVEDIKAAIAAIWPA